MNEQSFTLDKTKRNIREVRQTLIATTVEGDVSDLRFNLGLESISQRAHVLVATIHFRLSYFRSHAKRHDVCDRFSSGATLALLMAADLLRGDAQATTNEQRPDSFLRIHLVCGKRQQITAQRLHIYW